MPLYMQVSKSNCMLHLSEHYSVASPGATMRIETNELDNFHAELNAKQYRYAKPGIEDTLLGSRDLSVSDPFGNHLASTNAVSI